jgi:hypothetical protein
MPAPLSTRRDLPLCPAARPALRSAGRLTAFACALGLACALAPSARADSTATADLPAAAAAPPSAPGPRIELPPDVEDSAAPVPPAPPAPSPTPSAPSPTSAAPAASPPPAPQQAVPVQSEYVLGDAPPQGSSVTLNLPRQSQIDVAIDPRTRAMRGLAIGGYGEAVLNAPLDKSAPAVADLRRTILFLGFNFTDRIRFFSEIEFEHALTTDGKRGEVAVEQAILDFLFSRAINLRAGMILMPVGLINLYHEPSTFNGVERPDTDLLLIPSTWKQVGGGLFGALGPLRYQLYVVPGLRADGFSAAIGIRGGVQDNLARVSDPAGVLRLDIAPVLGLNLGWSGYIGGASQGDPNLGSAPVALTELDAKFGRFGLSVRAQLAYIHIGSAATISRTLQLVDLSGVPQPADLPRGSGPIASHMLGGYLELGYDLLRPFKLRSATQLIAFGRYERTHTQLDVPEQEIMQARQPGNDRSVYTAGLTLRPILEIAVKLDYQLRHSEVAGSTRHLLNCGIAYQF